ncbi:MAG: hypothetical protein GC150_17640 [Rhizobiales bacterium]|nr:hypothetical protein [Hyphomicrobiales bacterium]
MLAAVALQMQPAAAFTIGVSPARVEIELGPRPTTQSLKLINYGDKATTVNIRVANFDLDENNQIRELPSHADSLDQWILIRPLQVRIEAGETATVRFAIRPFTRPQPGEHRAMIFLEQQPDRVRDGSSIRVAYRLGVAVYAQAGDKRIASVVHGTDATPEAISVDAEARGNASSRSSGHYLVWPDETAPPEAEALAMVAAFARRPPASQTPPAGAVAGGALTSLPVFPGTRRTLLTPWSTPLEPGRYRVAYSGTVGERSLGRVVSLTIPRR